MTPGERAEPPRSCPSETAEESAFRRRPGSGWTAPGWPRRRSAGCVSPGPTTRRRAGRGPGVPEVALRGRPGRDQLAGGATAGGGCPGGYQYIFDQEAGPLRGAHRRVRHRAGHVRAHHRWPTAPRSRSCATSPRCCGGRRSGRRCSPSPRPDPTWPPCGPGRCATVTAGSLTGQKVWTSGALHLPVRPGAGPHRRSLPRHAGLTMFIVDLDTPGVTIRPLRQMTGHTKFAEIFFDEGRVGRRTSGRRRERRLALRHHHPDERTLLGRGAQVRPAGRLGPAHHRQRQGPRRHRRPRVAAAAGPAVGQGERCSASSTSRWARR